VQGLPRPLRGRPEQGKSQPVSPEDRHQPQDPDPTARGSAPALEVIVPPPTPVPTDLTSTASNANRFGLQSVGIGLDPAAHTSDNSLLKLNYPNLYSRRAPQVEKSRLRT